MTKWFVGRHGGALDWIRARGHGDARAVAHLDPTEVAPGDVVIGTLPVHLVAAVNAAGARYIHLVLDLPPEARGRELTAEEMDRHGARLVEFRVEEMVS